MKELGHLEYHVPSGYDVKRPAFIFKTTQQLKQTIHAPSRISNDRPSVLAPTEDLDHLVYDEDRPRRLEDWIYSDRPQLHIHVSTFTNATIVTVTWLHTLTDIMGISSLFHAWTAVLRGDPDETIPTPTGMFQRDDPLAALSKRIPPEKYVNYDQLLRGLGAIRLGVRFLLERLFYPREEERIVCVPAAYLVRLHAQAQQSLPSTLDSKPAFVSPSDVLFAWWARTVFAALEPQSNQTALLANIFDIRKSLAETDLLPPGRPYFGNALANAYTLLSVEQLLHDPLGHVALRIRKSLEQQRTVEQICAQAALNERAWAESAHPAYIGDGGTVFQVCANWNKAGLYSLDFSPALTDVRTESNGKASFIHTTRCTQASSWRNIGVVLGQDSAGDWWISWNLRAALWAKVEGLMKGPSGLQADQWLSGLP